MELWQEIFAKLFRDSIVEIKIPQAPSLSELFESTCYKALCEIKKIIEDDELEDSDCFAKIENIVRVFEKIGSTGGSRHDF